MPYLWFLLCGLLCTAQVWNAIWLSSPLAAPFTKADMDQHCSNDFSGGIALVCTQTQTIKSFFTESSDIFTRRPGGTWDTLNPIVRAGSVNRSLFGTGALLGTITDFNGVNATSNITHSCDSTGKYFDAGAACGGYYNQNAGSELVGRSGKMEVAWFGNLFFGLSLFFFALFALFVFLEASFESALAGTVVLALLYLALAAAFAGYATKLAKELAKLSLSSSVSGSSKASRGRFGMGTKIQLTGHLVAVSFVAQALCSVLALALPSEQLVGWTATFCLFNVVALLCILVVYSAAVLKAPEPASSCADTSASASRALDDRGAQEMQSLQ